MIDWNQAVTTVISAAAATIPLYLIRRKEHKENQDKLDALLMERVYLEPHDHLECRLPIVNPDTPLLVKNIIKGRRKVNGQ